MEQRKHDLISKLMDQGIYKKNDQQLFQLTLKEFE
ncbi:Fur-regulated basic protein FbpA [Neobacillus sp. SuZ13]|nr:Fur-regulated basic protein FbpA [Neobacillus sp. SuZ13]WHY69837.1 Fur-regulated basic protein FbpA [Neobacillus sp. SuZ13]